MRLVVGVDHAGFPLKAAVIATLQSRGHTVLDVGTDGTEPVDYPDIAELVASALLAGDVERGVLICGSGIGASVAANKAPGVRAAVCHDTYSARQGVEHDDMNVLCLGARVIGPVISTELVGEFVDANFTGEERHVRRLRKVEALEVRRWK